MFYHGLFYMNIKLYIYFLYIQVKPVLCILLNIFQVRVFTLKNVTICLPPEESFIYWDAGKHFLPFSMKRKL